MPGLNHQEPPPGQPQVYHRQLVAGLWAVRDRELEVRVHRLDAWSEQAVSVVVGIRDFRIRRAALAVYRDASGKAFGTEEVPELCGITAYLGAAKEFRRALAGREQLDTWVDLLLESVKALLQGEHCVAVKRGYASLEAYERYFRETFSGTCVYYALPPEQVRSWPVYLAGQCRDRCFFIRSRTTSLWLAEEHLVTSTLVDSYQQLILRLELEPGGMVLRAKAHTTRAPDPACGLAAVQVSRLAGLDLLALDRHQIGELLAGPRGCIHLADLAVEAATLLRSVREMHMQAGADTDAARPEAGIAARRADRP
ncbi:MAG: DUF2889 domain-containing protein [Clostridia bacterium]|jgi:hypothetical protein|nr:DUF2889 domain-containing protein [Clostridia bacterium]MDH7572473.1 DUF2889 domain-containing protein [Clostridia bacterium]